MKDRLDKIFNEKLVLNYHLYRSILLTLPFSHLENYGVLLSVFAQKCLEGLQKQLSPEEIVEGFFKENTLPEPLGEIDMHSVLFKFIQFIERQVVIFDSLEDAYFDELVSVGGEGTLDYFLNLVNAEWKYTDLAQKIRSYKVRIVLTAHPTQFYSVHILRLLRKLSLAIQEKDNVKISRLFRQLGKTHFYNRERMSPMEEVKSILVFLREVFYQQIPLVVEKIEREISSRMGESYPQPEFPNFIEIGFWPGGDRDGNPYVTHETTKKTAQHLRKAVIQCYLDDLKDLQEIFTFRGVYEEIKKIGSKLSHSLKGEGGEGYPNFQEFASDLEKLHKYIVDDHESIFLEDLDFFIRKTKCFGFYFASIDIRQDSRTYTRVVGELAQHQNDFNYEAATPKAKMNFLLKQQEAIAGDGSSSGQVLDDKNLLWEWIDSSRFSQETVETLKTVLTALEIQEKNGEAGLHRYVISNTRSEFNVLEVVYLFSWMGRRIGNLNFDIVPLFETMNDLKKAGEIMGRLYDIPAYRRHLTHRKEKQTVMLGFSDGTKDGGYVSANWAILKAKEAITRISRSHKVKVIFFDGRGGPPARGGGETNKFYSSLGKDVENHEIQLTVQGQTVSSKYGNAQSFTYNIEQLLVAGLEGQLFNHQKNELNADQRRVFEKLAKISYEAYTGLKGHPRFLEYLSEASPLRFYGEANVGSRPSKRVKDESLNLDNLRAIPFVSSWNQMKQNIPAYFGFGSALKKMFDDGEGDKVISLFKESAFFRTLVSNSIQALAKTNLDYTQHLSKDSRLKGIWKIIRVETDLTKGMIHKLSEKKSFFAENDVNRYSIPFREGIVTPLVIIQQYALAKLLKSRRMSQRKDAHGEAEKQVLEKLVIRSMPGLINAGRNSA